MTKAAHGCRCGCSQDAGTNACPDARHLTTGHTASLRVARTAGLALPHDARETSLTAAPRQRAAGAPWATGGAAGCAPLAGRRRSPGRPAPPSGLRAPGGARTPGGRERTEGRARHKELFI